MFEAKCSYPRYFQYGDIFSLFETVKLPPTVNGPCFSITKYCLILDRGSGQTTSDITEDSRFQFHLKCKLTSPQSCWRESYW